MPHSPSGSGCMTPPISPWPSLMMSMNALRSRLSAMARRISGLSKGGASRLMIRVPADPARRHLADRAGLLALDVPRQRQSCRGPIELTGDKREVRRRAVADDRKLDAVQIGSARLPVIRVARQRDPLVGFELDKFEWAGADRMLAHLSRRQVARINDRKAGSEQCEEGRLRPMQMEGDLMIAIGGHLLEVAVP